MSLQQFMEPAMEAEAMIEWGKVKYQRVPVEVEAIAPNSSWYLEKTEGSPYRASALTVRYSQLGR